MKVWTEVVNGCKTEAKSIEANPLKLEDTVRERFPRGVTVLIRGVMQGPNLVQLPSHLPGMVRT